MPSVSELRSRLAAVLPDYMIPSAFVSMDELPVTPNGKLDRKALPDPIAQDSGSHYRAPQNNTEIWLCEQFEALTGVKQVGVEDNFFALGGHSLLALTLLMRIRQQMQKELTLRDLFAYPTVQGLSALIDANQAGDGDEIVAGSGYLDDETDDE
jgi:acyl carrier protein